MEKKSRLLILLLSTILPLFSFSQNPNFIFSNINTGELDTLRYLTGTSEPDSSWFLPGFDDSSWSESIAAIGYGYNSEGYTVIDSTAKSLYVRFLFNIDNKSDIKDLNFLPDYDDGYIAYLNGVEIARVNVDKTATFPPFDAIATRSHASEFILGTTNPVLGIYLDSTFLSGCLVNGKNIMAVHVINDNYGDDMMFIPSLIDNSKVNKKDDRYLYRLDSRYKKLIDIDSTDIPLLIIETDQNGIAYDQRIWTTAHMGIVNNGEGNYNKPTDMFNDYDGLISIRSRGQSSRDFAKKSYRFELIDENAKDTSFALLGMPKESDWILYGPYSDKSQIRNKLAYDLSSRMGNYAPRTQFCELILNGQLEGLYILTEQIKRNKNRVDISKLKETDISGDDVTGGYIFKYDKADIFYKEEWVTNQRRIVYPDMPTDEQKSYLKQFFTVYDSILTKTNIFQDPEKGFRKYASDSSLIDFIIINEMVKNPDAYAFSTYMYKDRDDKDGRMKFGPIWDCDIAFGNSQFQQGFMTTGWQFEVNIGMRITRYFQDPKFVKLFQDRWHELRAKTFSNDSIFDYFDQLIDQVKFARERNYEVWPTMDKNIFYLPVIVDSYENEIALTKKWLTDRLDWMDNNVDKIYYDLKIVGNSPLESLAGNLNLRIFPNPFESELTIDFNMEDEGDVRIEIYNLTGQIQYREIAGNRAGYQKITINDPKIESLPKGMYVAKLIINNIPAQSVKVIKR